MFQNLKLGPPNLGIFQIDETILQEIKKVQLLKMRNQKGPLFLGTDEDILKRSTTLNQLYKHMQKEDKQFQANHIKQKVAARDSQSDGSDVDLLYNQMIDNSDEEKIDISDKSAAEPNL